MTPAARSALIGGASCCSSDSEARRFSGRPSSRKLASWPTFMRTPFIAPSVCVTSVGGAQLETFVELASSFGRRKDPLRAVRRVRPADPCCHPRDLDAACVATCGRTTSVATSRVGGPCTSRTRRGSALLRRPSMHLFSFARATAVIMARARWSLSRMFHVLFSCARDSGES